MTLCRHKGWRLQLDPLQLQRIVKTQGYTTEKQTERSFRNRKEMNILLTMTLRANLAHDERVPELEMNWNTLSRAE